MRKVCKFVVVVLLSLVLLPTQSFATDAFEGEFSLSSLQKNPCASAKAKVTCSDINEMLTKSALERDIPPEVAKAIALQESTWQQWIDDEQTIPNINPKDGGIGIMQVTDKGYDEERLKTDIQYNIDTGLDILNKKWKLGQSGSIPTINDNSRDVIEHWYFAVLAYNGLVEVNSPLYMKDGSKNTKAYQENVFSKIKEFSNLKLVNIPFKREYFDYDPNDNDASLGFKKLHYQVPGPLTKSRHLFSKGDKVYTVTGTNLRDKVSGGKSTRLTKRYVAEIIDSTIYYDTSSQSAGRHWVRYKIKLDDNRVGYVSSDAIEPITSRLSGDDRYQTAVEISKSGWQDGADTVVLAKGMDFPDALAGAPLAYKYNAPILLTPTNKLTSETKKEIKRLGANHVIILGSSVAISEAVEKELHAMKIKKVRRIGGEDRFETAQLIAKELNSKSGKAIVATGLDYPDALAVGPYAARNEVPILLTRANKLNKFTKQALKGVSTTYVVGGNTVVSDNVVEELPGKVTRISGDDRFGTAAAIVKKFNFGHQEALVATGLNFADALTGAVLAADKNAPLLLVRDGSVTKSTETLIAQRKIREFTLLGGPQVVNVDNQLAKLVTKQ